MTHSNPPLRAPRRRRAGAALVATALAAGTVALAAPGASAAEATPPVPAADTAGALTWGVKTSFRNYVGSVAPGGSITVSGGATQAAGNGEFTFPASTSWATPTEVDAAFDGAVRFRAHGGALDVTIEDLRVEVSGASGSLVADVTSLPNEPGADPVLYDDVTIADLDLTGTTPVVDGGTVTWTAVPAVLTEDGVPAFADFYDAGDALDPATFTLARTDVPAAVTADRALTNLDPCNPTAVTVSGVGFDPGANVSPGTRPPVPGGMATGVYVAFGRFADTWKPSEGAPGSARKVLDQRWAVPEPTNAFLAANFPSPQYRLLEVDGTFTLDLEILKEEGEGTFGIVTYAAGGAPANAAQETFTPVSFREGFVDVPVGHQFHSEISWLDEQCIAGGWPDGTFRPTVTVSRQAMASFLYKLNGSPEVPADAPTFTDVQDGHPFEDAIRWMASEGITTGYADGTFGTTRPVTRQATAAFLHRMAGSPAPDPAAPEFTDLPDGEFGTAIRWMAGEEITQGWPDDTFRPTLPVSRQAAAAFLSRIDVPLADA